MTREPLTLVRLIPPGATVEVAAGDHVEPETVLATGHLDRKVLRLPAGDNFELLKKPGDPVKKGEAVAVMEELFGLGLRELVSPCDGVMESVNARRTALVLTGSDAKIRALVRGRVEAVEDSEVRLQVRGERIRGWFGFGRAVAGEVYRIHEFFTPSEVRRRIGPEVAGRVVLCASFVLPEVITTLARYGAAALVCASLDFAPLWDLISPTGPHPAGRGLPTLVVVEGFGVHGLGPEAAGTLGAAEGRVVYAAGPALDRLVFAGPPYAEVLMPG